MSKNRPEPPNLEAEIALSYDTITEVNAVVSAVSPDNAKTPEALTIKTVRRVREVLTNIKSGSSLMTFIATIDDLLEAVSIAERAISAMKEH